MGKIGIPDAILQKRGKLDPDQWREMQRHCLYGAKILESATSRIIQCARIIAMTHHERFDGSGYPHRLSGEEIPIFGRICAVADVFDALTSRRPYKEPFSNEKSLAIMRAGRGSHFDPRILDVFISDFDKVEEIQREFVDSSPPRF